MTCEQDWDQLCDILLAIGGDDVVPPDAPLLPRHSN